MKPAMDYVGRIFRPPSEARSLLLQVTIGCSHNRCTYCDMYRDKRFSAKPWDVVQRDIAEASAMGPGHFKRVFLCDGDALILSTSKLRRILEAIKQQMPWVERVGVYGDTRSVGRKTIEELTALRQAGLGIVYHGMETGSDAVLEHIDKGGTRQEAIATAEKLRQAGIAHSVMVLLGVGGRRFSAAHARDTGTALSAMNPDYIGVLTTTVVPGTPLHEEQAQGRFELPGQFELLEELRTIVAGLDVSDCRFSCNHASNYLPLTAPLPDGREALLKLLDKVLKERRLDWLKPEYLRGL